MSRITCRLLSSLEKVFADTAPQGAEYVRGSMLQNEQFSFQLAVKPEQETVVKLKSASPVGDCLRVFRVENVPCGTASYQGYEDDDYLRKEKGMYPDLLREYEGEAVRLPAEWSAFWFLAEPQGKREPGLYPVEIQLLDTAGDCLAEAVFTLEILAAELPEQTLIHTEWLYTDCLAQQYRTKMFSARFWEMLEQYLRTAARFGMNMVYTPVVTSLLSSKTGLIRPETQLVEVFAEGGGYRFDFSNLDRFIDLAQRCGIRYFEICHLFTQWGASNPAQVSGWENGEKKLLFGFDTPAADPRYREFLSAFLPALAGFLEEKGLKDRCYFHVSDEPHLDHLAAYSAAAEMVRAYLPGNYKMMDALSDFDFYASGAVQVPVPSNDHLEPFLAAELSERWTYYCCAQGIGVSNRFIAMPSYRNRVLGLQLYKYRFDGFLHWGYNYWQDLNSARPIDPFAVTDVEGYFPSGDAFLVYPGEDGPLLSIRMLVLMEGLQDMRALQLLEARAGRQKAMELLNSYDPDLSFTSYPRSAEKLLALREAINAELAK